VSQLQLGCLLLLLVSAHQAERASLQLLPNFVKTAHVYSKQSERAGATDPINTHLALNLV
jgi:hypothetical protein